MPARASRIAVASPTTPPPMTAASTCMSHELAEPYLEAEQRPDEEAVVVAPGGVVVDHRRNERGLEILLIAAARAREPPPDVVETLAPVPGVVGTAHVLLLPFDCLPRNESTHLLRRPVLPF